ncbi:fibrous sheath CABYR-binding protein [Phymastichus coffea]|uniref:fibrous sheath CABYR-binding protein n=1 Tax=Phymastichus coffea TaxID=108790 RepID=UPI00273B3B1A|nr:fibrous sheath CABYR-binding protein [Phymastichus coffea]
MEASRAEVEHTRHVLSVLFLSLTDAKKVLAQSRHFGTRQRKHRDRAFGRHPRAAVGYRAISRRARVTARSRTGGDTCAPAWSIEAPVTRGDGGSRSPAVSRRLAVMPRAASSTGLIAARVKPVRRPKPKAQKLELMGPAVRAPFGPRPSARPSLRRHDGCAARRHHPADGEAAWTARRADGRPPSAGRAPEPSAEADGAELVPEELFRRYTETDSRPASPRSPEPAQAERERTQLVLDLRASPREVQVGPRRGRAPADPTAAASPQPAEALSWRGPAPEPPTGRRAPRASPPHRSAASTARSPPADDGPPGPAGDAARDCAPEAAGQPAMRRRGRLRRGKRKCRRASIYGQPTEVREPPEPSETQVSQTDGAGRRAPPCPRAEETGGRATPDGTSLPSVGRELPPSFLPREAIRALSRRLDRELVECEFNAKRRFALEEALRVVSEMQPPPARAPRVAALPTCHEVPRLFYRQSARFELLDGQSLVGLRPLDYLARHAHVSDARKAVFLRAFNKFREDEAEGPRHMLADCLREALREVMGRPLTDREFEGLQRGLGPTGDRLHFRAWCGLCAFAERVVPELPPRDRDPASWLERADFEMLEKRLRSVKVDARLADMLRLIRDR